MNLKQAYNEIVESNVSNEERKRWLEDLTQHGAISGMVGGLIYYKETNDFYDSHENEIRAMLNEMMEQTGFETEKELFGEKWLDREDLEQEIYSNDYESEEEREDAFQNIDPFENMYNKNLLAWFAIEELARQELEGAE